MQPTRLLNISALTFTAFCFAGPSAQAATILFDLNAHSSTPTETNIDGEGRQWNNINALSGFPVTDALDTDGNTTTVDWVGTDAFLSSITGATTASSVYPGSATSDGHQVTTTNGATVDLRGLVAGNQYNLTFYGSRPFTNRAATYTVADFNGDGTSDDPSGQTLVTSFNIDNTVQILGATATSAGIISIDITAPTGASSGSLNVLEVSDVPEPSSLALASAGALCLIRRRRAQA